MWADGRTDGEKHTTKVVVCFRKGKGKVIPLQARCGPEGG